MKALKVSVLSMLAMFFCLQFINAQETLEELQAKKAEAAAKVAAASAELSAIEGSIAKLPGWRIGGVGVVGVDFSGNNNWYAVNSPDATSNGIGIGFNGYANNIQPKFFWRNLVNVTIQRTVTDSNEPNNNRVVALSEGLDLSSLYGYRINPKLAVSAEGKFTSSIISYDSTTEKYEQSLFDPAKLTVSAGLTWTPLDALVVLIHPLGYEKNWPGEFISAAGAKIGAQYSAVIFKGISWSSNLSLFVPYSGEQTVDYDIDGTIVPVTYAGSDLINYTWINGFSAKIFNGIGVALNVGLRGDNQIADRGILMNDVASTETNQFVTQLYYTLGLAYTF